MPNTGDNEGKERRIRDMLGLVKFCLETTSKEDASGQSSHIEPMDPDRMAWLQQAMSSMTIDTTRQLLENLALVKETIIQLKKPNQDVAVQKTCNSMEILTDLCEEIDYASDFAKLDGFSIFKPLISCSHEELIVKSCELIAALAQNNPLCQNIAMDTRLLEQLVDFVDLKKDLPHIKARSYALYAISSIIRSNQEVRTHFETTLDGLSVLIQLLNHNQLDQAIDSNTGSPMKHGSFSSSFEDSRGSSIYWWRKLRIRSIFLFRTLCLESSTASKFFFEKQAISQVINQLKQLQDPEIREHLLHALKAFLDSLDNAKQIKSMEDSPDLKDVVERIFKSTSEANNDDYDLTDTKSICEDLLNLIKQFQIKK